MTKCRQARALFDAYWDNEASQAEREWLESHMTACTACRRSYEDLARVLEGVARVPREEATADFVESTVSRARRAVAEPDRVRAGGLGWVSVAAAATVMLVMATVMTPWIMVGRPPAPTGEMAVRAPREPQLIKPSSIPENSTASPTGMVAVVDSLIDHTEDVEFILDPVHVSRGRAAVSQRPAPAQGQQAIITF